MQNINTYKLAKLEERIRVIVDDLNQHNDLSIHNTISHSYYMEKAEELKIIKEELQQAQARLERIQNLVCGHYADVYSNWRRDIRWLNSYLLRKGPRYNAGETT
jgi:hypothetical protein